MTLVKKIKNISLAGLAGFGMSYLPMKSIGCVSTSLMLPEPISIHEERDAPDLSDLTDLHRPVTQEQCEEVLEAYNLWHSDISREILLDSFAYDYENHSIEALANLAIIGAYNWSGINKAADAFDAVNDILRNYDFCSLGHNDEDESDRVCSLERNLAPNTISLQNLSGNHIRIYISAAPFNRDEVFGGSIDLYEDLCRQDIEPIAGYDINDYWRFTVTDPNISDPESEFFGDLVLDSARCKAAEDGNSLLVLWNGDFISCGTH